MGDEAGARLIGVNGATLFETVVKVTPAVFEVSPVEEGRTSFSGSPINEHRHSGDALRIAAAVLNEAAQDVVSLTAAEARTLQTVAHVEIEGLAPMTLNAVVIWMLDQGREHEAAAILHALSDAADVQARVRRRTFRVLGP